jgi:hypothetical protein
MQLESFSMVRQLYIVWMAVNPLQFIDFIKIFHLTTAVRFTGLSAPPYVESHDNSSVRLLQCQVA